MVFPIFNVFSAKKLLSPFKPAAELIWVLLKLNY